MIRVLYLSTDPGIPVLGHKGASVHLREMAGAMADLGAEVVIASSRTEALGAAIRPAVRVIEIPAVVGDGRSVGTVRRALASQRRAVRDVCLDVAPDIVYERFALFSDAGVRAAAGERLPHLLEVNSPLRAEARRWRTLPHPELAAELERAVCTGSERIFCVSSAVADAVCQWVTRDRVDVIPNGVAARLFASPATPPGSGPVTIGFAGSLKPWHGVETMMAALARVFDAGGDVRVEVAGAGPMLDAVRTHALPPERVSILGPLDHETVTSRMRMWHIGLAPYVRQPRFYFSPLKVLEYMAAGICVVASAQGQIRDLLGDGSRGVLVEPDDPSALADAILTLVADRPRMGRLGARARAYTLAHHTWERNAGRVLALARPTLGRAA